jgi:hypothetical protein
MATQYGAFLPYQYYASFYDYYNSILSYLQSALHKPLHLDPAFKRPITHLGHAPLAFLPMSAGIG